MLEKKRIPMVIVRFELPKDYRLIKDVLPPNRVEVYK